MATDYERVRAEHIREYGEGTRHLAFLGKLYPDRTHFVYEILQNAEDARATRISFSLFADRLEVSHDGVPFDEGDVRAICGVDAGLKANDPTRIGKFGIGFKSVYSYTAHPEIHSGDEHFRIESFVRPHAVAARQLTAGETLFVLPFDSPDVPPPLACAQIAARLAALEVRTLLFLRHLESIRWQIEGGASARLERRERPRQAARQVDLSRHGVAIEGESWLVFSRHKRLERESRALSRWVEIAFRLEGEALAATPRSPLVVFFPTERETHLGFVLQGPFRTTPARDNVPADDEWNRQLAGDGAELLAEALPQLRDMGLLGLSALEALPLRSEDFPPGSMLRPLFERTVQALRSLPLLPSESRACASAAETRLAADESIRALLSPEQLGHLYRSDGPLHWLSAEISRDRTPDLHTYLRLHLGIEEVSADTLAARCDEDFVRRQSDEWLTRLYGYLLLRPALWRAAGAAWGEGAGPLRERPFVRLASGAHVRPFAADGSPNAYLPPREPTDYPVVAPSIAAEPRAREFLVRLGLTAPDIVVEVLERILPKYGRFSGTGVPADEHGRDIAKILRALGTDSETQKARLLERLQRTPFVAARNAASAERTFARPSAVYFRSRSLERYFAAHPQAAFLDEDEADSAAWETLGVARLPRRIADELALTADEKRELRARQRAGWSADLDAVDYELDGLAPFLERSLGASAEERERDALLLWSILGEHLDRWPSAGSERFFHGVYRWLGHRGEEHAAHFPSLFLKQLRSAAWLPDRRRIFHPPAAIALDELPEDFARDEVLAAALGMRRDDLDTLARSHGVSPEVIRFALRFPEKIEALRQRYLGEEDSVAGAPAGGEAPVAGGCAPFSARVLRWHAAWESRDVERLLTLYSPEATHASPQVRVLYPEANADVLAGREQIGEYFRRALGRFTTLRLELRTVVESADHSAIEYLRHSNVDARPRRVLELLEWNGTRIHAARVFHAWTEQGYSESSDS